MHCPVIHSSNPDSIAVATAVVGPAAIRYWKDRAEKAERRADAAERRVEALEAENRELKRQIEVLMARVAQLEHELFNRKTEKKKKDKKQKKQTASSGTSSSAPQDDNSSTGKGKRGRKKPDRRNHDNLPLEHLDVDLPEDEKRCNICKQPFKSFPDLEEGETIEVEVKAYRRRVRRKRYKKECNCKPQSSRVVTARSPGKVVPKGKLGISVWVTLLTGKYLFYQPIERQLKELELSGVSIAAPTVTDGFKRIKSLLEPVYDAIAERNREEDHWHVDESRWMVAEKVEGKESTRWWIWVFKSVSTVFYKLSMSRSAEVLKEHLEGLDGTISCDRYSAYGKFAAETSGGIDLAYCWSHTRRDFIAVGKGYPDHNEWVDKNLEEIGYLYHLHSIRRVAYTEGQTSDDFLLMDEVFHDAVLGFKESCKQEYEEISKDDPRSLPLENIDVYWQGLSMVLSDPMLDMDNNAAERAIRGPVIGRKNYWGSLKEWSGHLAMIMFTIFQTLLLWNINPKTWLSNYLSACAAEGGVPVDIDRFLPWSASQEDYKDWSKDAPKADLNLYNDSS